MDTSSSARACPSLALRAPAYDQTRGETRGGTNAVPSLSLPVTGRHRLPRASQGLDETERDSWEAHIDFDRSVTPHRITIHHTLWHAVNLSATAAQAADSAANRLRFQTELLLVFAPGSVSELTRSDLKIVDYDFEGSLDRPARDEAKGALKPLCLPQLEYLQIWKRPLHRLPVHKDVPRLLKGMVIVGPDGSELYHDDGTAKPADPPAQIAALRQVMVALARCLDGEPLVRSIEEQLPNFLTADTGDVAGGLRHFLLESGIPETSLFVQVIPAVHQDLRWPSLDLL